MLPDARLTTALAEHYTLVQELGRGGMATVWLARDVKHDREVALKVLRPELAAVLGRERFLAEIRLTAKLDHPHILALLDSGESDGFLWYTLPYIRGESLRHKLERETQLGVEEAVRIGTQVAGALHHAHQHGIIHRDVKPENILLHEGEAMLADFGIALAVKEAGGQRLTETGLSVGTPQYMSPEQATAGRQLDARSDVYSLGAVLYEMLAGEPPFTGPTGQAVIAKLMVESPSSLRTVRGTTPPGLEAVVLRALSKVPADRFPTAAAFAEALAAPGAHRAKRRVSKRLLIRVGTAVGLLVGTGLWLAPRFRPGPSRWEPTLAQLTFSGDAYEPALSPDATQLAYAVVPCGAPGRCKAAVVVEDLASGERRTVADSFRIVYGLNWSPDQRSLTLKGVRGAVWGQYVLSLFGGREYYLGQFTGGRFIGSSDTIIAAPDSVETAVPLQGATRWFLLLSREGRRLDSIPYTLPGSGNYPAPYPSPDGRRVLIWIDSNSTTLRKPHLYLIDRAGRLTDSFPSPTGFFNPHQGLGWAKSGDGIVMMVRDSAWWGHWRLLRFSVSEQGRVRLPADTITDGFYLPERMSTDWHGVSQPSLNGGYAMTLATFTGTVFTMERPSLASPVVRGPERLRSTKAVSAVISPDGDRILVERGMAVDGTLGVRLEVWPFEGAPGARLGPARRTRLGDAARPLRERMEWSQDGRAIYLLVSAGKPGLLDYTTVDASTGRVLQSRAVPDSLEWRLCDSLLLYRSRRAGPGTPSEWSTFPGAGPSSLTFSFPDTTLLIQDFICGPDGHGSWHAALLTSRDVSAPPGTAYSVYVAQPNRSATLAMEFSGPYAGGTFVLPGPPWQVVVQEQDGKLQLLHLEPGRPPRRLGPMPTVSASLSADGRRGVLVERGLRTDIWLLSRPGADSARAK